MVTACNDCLTDWMDQAGKFRILGTEEVIEIAYCIQSLDANSKQYNRLVNKLTTHNLRLVINFVQKFMSAKSPRKWGSPETLDYLQQGTMGLRRAAQMYDPTRGYKFSTYATPWIRSFVSRYNMKNSSIFHISENAMLDAWHFAQHGYMKGRKGKSRRDKNESAQLAVLVHSAQSPLSLDHPTGEDQTISLMDAIATPEGRSFEVFEELISSAGLNDLEKEILRSIYLDDLDTVRTAMNLGISKWQVRYLRAKAISLLKEKNTV